MWRRLVTTLAAAIVVMALTGCRVEVTVDVAMVQNGSGTLTVTISADRDVVEQAPGLAGDLRLDDLTDAGWTTDGPVGTPDGGLAIVLVHGFDTPGQATALLASLNGPDGPFEAVSFTREGHQESIEYRIAGRAKVNGLTGFADQDLVDAIGGTPYADDIADDDLVPDEAVGLTFTAQLPGTIDQTTAVDDAAAPLAWAIPLDDTVVDLTTVSTVSLSSGRGWTTLATLAFVALGLWVMFSIVLIVVIARRQHHRRSRRRSLAALADLEARDDYP